MRDASQHGPATTGSRRVVRLLWWAVGVVPGVALLTVHARRYLPFIADDALISLRYAENLLAGRGLVWNAGERVEGYSNLLWTLSVAAAGALGADLIDAARMLGLASAAGVIVALAALVPRTAWAAAATACLGLAAASLSPLAVWSIGGLEQAQFAFLFAVHVAAVCRGGPGPLRLAIATAALLSLARPDGILLAVVPAWAGAVLGRRDPDERRRLVVVAGAACLAAAGQLTFRLGYYGEWLPNTARAKLAFSRPRLTEGLGYLGGGLWHAAPLVAAASLLAALALSVTRSGTRALGVILAPLAAWGGYVALIGGDVFPAYRHWIPLDVGVLLVASWAVGRLAGLDASSAGAALLVRSAKPVALAVLALTPPLLWPLQGRDPEIRRAKDELWEWEGQAVGEFLRRHFGAQQPLLAASAAGCLPYFSKLPALDTLGLTDAWLAHHPPPDLGQGRLAHELGDAGYVLRRAPDLLFLGGPRGRNRPGHRFERELLASDEFASRYARRSFRTPSGLVFRVWLRRDSGSVGWTSRSDGWWPIYALGGGTFGDCPDGGIGLSVGGDPITLSADPTAAPVAGVELRSDASLTLARLDTAGQVVARVVDGVRLEWRAEGEGGLRLQLSSERGGCVTHVRLLHAEQDTAAGSRRRLGSERAAAGARPLP